MEKGNGEEKTCFSLGSSADSFGWFSLLLLFLFLFCFW